MNSVETDKGERMRHIKSFSAFCKEEMGLLQSEWVQFVIPAKAGIQYPPP
jgi:hypothetical protein